MCVRTCRLLYQNPLGNASKKKKKIMIPTHRKKATQTTLKMVIKPQEKRTIKGRKKTYKNKPKTIKKMALGTYIFICSVPQPKI